MSNESTYLARDSFSLLNWLSLMGIGLSRHELTSEKGMDTSPVIMNRTIRNWPQKAAAEMVYAGKVILAYSSTSLTTITVGLVVGGSFCRSSISRNTDSGLAACRPVYVCAVSGI